MFVCIAQNKSQTSLQQLKEKDKYFCIATQYKKHAKG